MTLSDWNPNVGNDSDRIGTASGQSKPKSPKVSYVFSLLRLLGALTPSLTMIAQKNVLDCLFKFHQAPIATSKTGLACLILLIKSKTRL